MAISRRNLIVAWETSKTRSEALEKYNAGNEPISYKQMIKEIRLMLRLRLPLKQMPNKDQEIAMLRAENAELRRIIATWEDSAKGLNESVKKLQDYAKSM